MSNLDWPEVEVSNDFFFLMFLHSQFSHFSIVTVARMQPVELRDRCQCNSAWAIYDHEILKKTIASLNTPCKTTCLESCGRRVWSAYFVHIFINEIVYLLCSVATPVAIPLPVCSRMRVVDARRVYFEEPEDLVAGFAQDKQHRILLELWSQSITTITAYVIFNLPIFENVAVKVRAVVQRPVGCRKSNGCRSWAAIVSDWRSTGPSDIETCFNTLLLQQSQQLQLSQGSLPIHFRAMKRLDVSAFRMASASPMQTGSSSRLTSQILAQTKTENIWAENWTQARAWPCHLRSQDMNELQQRQCTGQFHDFQLATFLKQNKKHKSRFDLPFWPRLVTFVFFAPANALAAEVEHGLDQWKDLAKTYGVDLILTAHRHIQEAGTKSLATW